MVGSQFKARNIDFILNDVAETFPDSDSGEVGLKSGQKVQADLIVSCKSRVDAARLLSTVVSDQVRTSGPRPNTELLASSFGTVVLSEEKRVLVSPQLQVVNHPSVFAAGDIVDWPEQKQIGKTVGQAAVVVANIMSRLAGRPLKKEYNGSPEIIILANGKV
jgi:thioredoxin reductase